jgi:hypothetical protein
MVVLNAVDSEIAPQLGKAKEYEIGICNFSDQQSCLSMVGGSLRVLRLPPPLKLVAMI